MLRASTSPICESVSVTKLARVIDRPLELREEPVEERRQSRHADHQHGEQGERSDRARGFARRRWPGRSRRSSALAHEVGETDDAVPASAVVDDASESIRLAIIRASAFSSVASGPIVSAGAVRRHGARIADASDLRSRRLAASPPKVPRRNRSPATSRISSGVRISARVVRLHHGDARRRAGSPRRRRG